MQRQVAFILIISVVLLAGCWDERLYKDSSVISIAGIEGHLGEMKAYYAYPSSNQDPTKFIVIESEGTTPRDSRNKADLKIEQTLDLSELSTLLMFEDTAKDDIYTYLDVYYRNAQNPLTSKFALTNRSPKDFVSINKSLSTEIGEYYERFIESFERSSIFPKGQDLQQVATLLFSEGKDLALPYLGVDEEKGTPIAEGLALFDERKFTGTTLDINDSQLLILLTDGKANTARSTYIYEEDGTRTPLTVDILEFKKKIKIKEQGNSATVNITPSIEVNIDEFPIDHVNDKQVKDKVEKFLEKKLKEKIEKMIQKCVEANSDPLGIGKRVEAYHPNLWKKGKWKEIYPTLKFNTKVKVEIIRTGILN